MPPHFDPTSAPFDVVVLVATADALEATAAVLADLPAELPAAVLIGGTGAAVDVFSRHTRRPVALAEHGAALRPGHVYLSPPHAVLEVRPDRRCAVTPLKGAPPSERPLDRLLASLAVSHGSRVLTVILAGPEQDGVRGACALRGVGGTVLVQDPATADPSGLPRTVIEAGAANLVLSPQALGRAGTELLSGRRGPPGQEATERPWAEPRTEDLLERMGEAYCVLDRDFRILSVNAAAERLLGVPRTALLGRSHWEAFPASVDAPVGRAFRRVVAEGVKQHFTHHYTGEGHDLYLEVDAYPTGEGGVAMFWRDVTGRVRADRALRESEEKHRALFTEMDEAYAVVEVLQDAAGRWTDFRFLDANPAFLQHTGMPDPVGRTATELLGTPNPRWAELYGQVVQTGRPMRVEENELTLGRVFDLNIFRLGGAGSRQVAVLFTDITERKRREANQALLIDISRDLGQPLSEEKLFYTVGAKLAAHLGLTCYHYVDVDESRREAKVRHFWHALDVPSVLGTHPLAGFIAPERLSGLRGGETTVIHDVQDALRGDAPETAGLRAGTAAQKIGAYVTVPYSYDGRWKAYFAVADSQARQWTRPEIELIQEVAGRLLPQIERLRAEEALRVSEAQYRLAEEAAHAFSYAWNLEAPDATPDRQFTSRAAPEAIRTLLDTRAPTYSGGFTRVLGYRQGEVPLTREAWQGLIHPDDLKRVSVEYEQQFSSGHYAAEYRLRHQDGRYLDVFDRGMVISNEQGHVRRIIGSVVDITERKQRERHREFLLKLSDGLRTEADADAIAHRTILLLAEELKLDRCYITFYRPDDDQADFPYQVGNDRVPPLPDTLRLSDFPDAYERVRNTTFVLNDDFERQGLSEAEKAKGMRAMLASTAHQGERQPISSLVAVSSRPRCWTPGEIELIENVAERTWAATERARAEEAHRASEVRFRAVANLVPDLLWESGPDGFTPWYNQRWLDYTGQTFEQATGWGWTDAIHPEDREGSTRRYRQAVQAGQPLRQEHRIRRHDGEYRWFVVNTFPLRDERGEVIRVYGAATDIHHLREKSAVLEEQVVERTRRLADLNAELGNVIIRTAHNLETPARRLDQLLNPGQRPDPAARDEFSSYNPDDLYDEVTRLKGIARDLRQLARLEQQDLTKELLPLGELFGEVRAATSTTPRGSQVHGSQVHWQIHPLPIVQGNRALLRQALEVLMLFTLSETRGAQYVRVSSQQVEGEVQVTVEDDGIGLSGEEAATLFDLAVRTDQSVPVLEGSGLIQVRRILARHGGWAWAEAQRTRGKVVLAFPRDDATTELEALLCQDRPGR